MFKSRSILVLFSLAATIIILCDGAALAAETSKPVTLAGQALIEPKAGEPVDVAPFGEIRSWDNGKDIGVMWEDAREIFKVVVTFAEGATVPDPSTVKLQYFKIGWPQQRVPRDKLIGSGSTGWTTAGDWFGGHWETADAQVETGLAQDPTNSNSAANLFQEVPLDHWAYAAVNQLTHDGIIVSYPKEGPEGRKASTRSEFAQALARVIPTIKVEIERLADNKGEKSRFNIDDASALQHLANEFRDELRGMGVDPDALKRDIAELNQKLTAQSDEKDRVRMGSGVKVFAIPAENAPTTTAQKPTSAKQTRWIFTFNPINAREFPDQKNFDAKYRQAMKLRLLFPEQAPQVASFQAFTDSTWQQGSAVVEWGGTATDEQVWDGRVEAFNGYITAVRPLGGKTAINADRTWASTVKGTTDGVILDYWFAKPVSVNSFDETVITVRTKQHSFSFRGCDFPVSTTPIVDWKPVFIRDFGVLIKGTRDDRTYSKFDDEYRKAGKCLFDRVSEMPEQTLDKAWADMPTKGRIYMPLSVEGGRQHFGVYSEGHIGMDKGWIARIKGSDTGRTKWEGNRLWIRVHLAHPGGGGASLEDGYLPIPTTWYEENGVRYSEEAFATTLSGKLPPGGRIAADEPEVLMVKLSVFNSGKEAAKAKIPLDVWTSGAELIALKDGIVYSKLPEGEVARFCIDNKSANLKVEEKQLVCEFDLAPGATKECYLAIPYLTPSNAEEIEQLKALKYDKQHKMIASYWRKRADEGCSITTPEPLMNDFYRANMSHQLINSECEVGSNDRYMAKVGTFNYGVYTNESVMMASEIDRRGYHDVAEKIYETWIHYQGTVALPGDYTTAEGEFYGANRYESGGYNQHHGWAMWGMAEHYWFTRDKAWLTRVAPNLVKACDWIATQRARTKTECVGIRAIEYGLLPPGSLEDIGDWRSWLSNNAFSYWGLEDVARALADINHPEAPRLLAEARSYKNDIRRAFFEAMERTPVVRLRDGTSVPNIPSEVHRRGRSLGWITETLEGSIHLIRCGLVAPDEPAAKWIMQDYEDNRYISDQFGYQVQDFEKQWFSLGGFSQQPSLLCSPTPYLMRDEPKQYLRSYFNAFAAGYFPERAMITEHPLPKLGDYGGDHFKSSDEAMNSSWIRFMFIWDEGDDLYLGKMIPRYWLANSKELKIERAATHFGPMSMSMKSSAAKGSIAMTINPPTRNQPKTIYARFRHPDGKKMTRVTVNGKAWDKFEAEKEWVVLPALTEKTVVVAYYD